MVYLTLTLPSAASIFANVEDSNLPRSHDNHKFYKESLH